jgi:hypothetical protein
MICKAKVAVCYYILTKHSTQNEHRVEILNVKPGGTLKKSQATKRLIKRKVFLRAKQSLLRLSGENACEFAPNFLNSFFDSYIYTYAIMDMIFPVV